MFFFKKKKLIEIDDKINSLLEQLQIYSCEQKVILDEISCIKNSAQLLEERIQDNNGAINNNQLELKMTITKEISNLKKALDTQKKRIDLLSNDVMQAKDSLQKSIADEGKANQSEIEKKITSLDNNMEMVDSSLRMLLLNSVMDRMDE